MSTPNCPLTLRIPKGSRLTHAELDNNFLSLRNCINNLENTFVTGSTFNYSTYDLTLFRNDGNTIVQNLAGLANDIYVTSGQYDPQTGNVVFTNVSGGTFTVSGFTTGFTNYYTTDVTLIDSTLVFDRNDSLSAYTVDLSSLVVRSNSIFVDAKYGDDATGEYGNLAKPFKTIVAAQAAAINYMNANPLGGETEPFKYYDLRLNIFSTVGLEDLPRIRIHIAPGIYNAEDEFQYIIDNPTVFPSAQDLINPNNAKINSSFNLMLNFVDYELDAGAVLVNYGFSNYNTTSAVIGYTDYDYDVLGMSTNVYGKGNIICYKSVAGLFFPGVGFMYIEHDCKVHLECNSLVLYGFASTFGGLLEIKCENFIHITIPGGSEFGSYAIYLEGNRLNQKPSYVNCTNFIQCYYDFNDFVHPNAFMSGGANFNFKCVNFLGRSLQENLNLELYKEFRSADALIGWINNFFINNAFSPAVGVSSYIDNYSLPRSDVFIEIDYLKVGKYVLGVSNNASRKNFVNFNAKKIDFIYDEDIAESLSAAVIFVNGNQSVYNTQTTFQADYIEVFSSAGNDVIKRFIFLWVDTLARHDVFIKNTNIKVRNTDIATDINSDMIAFIGVKPSYGSASSNVRPSINNVVFESVNQLATDYFISVKDLNYDVKLYQDSYSNVGNNPLTTVTNLIPGSNLVVDNNVIAI